MPYTTHGYWYGPGEPTQPGPRFVARCGGPGLCDRCAREAAHNAPTAEQPCTACASSPCACQTELMHALDTVTDLVADGGLDALSDEYWLAKVREAARARADAVLAVLAKDPGDLQEQTREAIAEAWGQCGRDWLDKAAAAALSVRWEHAAHQAAEIERLRDELADARGQLPSPGSPSVGSLLALAQQTTDAFRRRAENAYAERDDARIRLGGARIYQDDLEKQKRRAEAERDALKAAHDRLGDLIESYPPGSAFAQSGAQKLFRRMHALDIPADATGAEDHYIHVTYGPWDSSGHQCGDIVVGGCDEPVPSRLVTVHSWFGERVIGSELGDCPNRCNATPAPETSGGEQ